MGFFMGINAKSKLFVCSLTNKSVLLHLLSLIHMNLKSTR